MNTVRPLDRFALVRAHNADDAREAFAAIYSNCMTVEAIERGNPIDVIINNCPLSDIGLNYTGYGADVRVHFSGSKFITLSFPVAGRGRLPINGIDRILGPQRGLVTPAATSFAAELTNSYEHVVLRLDPKALAKKLSAIIGVAIDGELQFEPLLDFSNNSAALLRDHFFALVDMISTSAADLPRLVKSEFEQTIMVMFLHASRHNYSHLLDADTPDAALAAVRRVESYIEANWQQPVTLESLAAVAGTSVLSLFRSFRKYRGYSPMQFAESVRNRRRDLP